ncbi:gll0302 [Gloeobacter violaceus PCC 7421]|uniref:Gll0302 protein n=2 Tax=Gloeobacter violaceus TaxID=33072 RepID=Q7NNV6_GLOVI|nr:gll0302 [Gloeobacter violaceus PCC 7421]
MDKSGGPLCGGRFALLNLALFAACGSQLTAMPADTGNGTDAAVAHKSDLAGVHTEVRWLAQQAPSAPVSAEPSGSSEAPNAASTVGQSPANNGEVGDLLDETVVTATRTRERVQDVPRTVTVVSRRQVEQQSLLTTNLGDILGFTVPGYSAPSDGPARGTYRGRDVQTLIDGIPQTGNYAYSNQLRFIVPVSIEQIEAVGGPSALYGDGATGGTINILTRRGTETPQAKTRIGFNLGLSNLSGGPGYLFEQFASGKAGAFDYAITASYTGLGSVYDARGAQIPNEWFGTLGNTNTYNLYGKFGLDLGADQRLQFTAGYANDLTDPNSISDPAVTTSGGLQFAGAKNGRIQIQNSPYSPQPTKRNLQLALEYNHNKFLGGSKLLAQASHRNSFELTTVNDSRFTADGSGGPFDSINRGVWGEYITTARVQVETPFSDNFKLLWGSDFKNDPVEAWQLETFDPKIYDESGGFIQRRSGNFLFNPAYTLTNIAGFLQANWNISDQWIINGGLRYENVSFSVGDFVASNTGQSVTGGSLNFNSTVFNLGVVYKPSNEISLFANFGQGFSLPVFANPLTNASSGFAVSNSLTALQPKLVDSYELGVRGRWRSIQSSLSAYYTFSSLDVGFVQVSPTQFQSVRSPQRTYGLEATLYAQPGPGWTLGTTAAWVQGEQDPFNTGDYYPLNSYSVNPLKATFYLENQTAPGWRNRLQVLFSGYRDVAYNAILPTGFRVEQAPVGSYATVDYLSSIQMGAGTLEVGVRNLLNNQYSPVYSQYLSGFNDRNNFAARGATLNVAYNFGW